MKRIFDLVLASLLFIVLALPLMAVVLLIKLADGGPVFFRQERVGQGGCIFYLWKFRTMRERAEQEESRLTMGRDPRITPVGAFLRRLKLDELPQLINVIKGDMSLVGPRPQPADIFQYYSPAARAQIVEMRPGITGVGSVLFRDEERLLQESTLPPKECHRDVFAPIKEELETWYVDHQGLLLDLELILLTALAVVAPRSRLYQFGLKRLGLPARLIAAPQVARRMPDDFDDGVACEAPVRRSPLGAAPSARRAVQKR